MVELEKVKEYAANCGQIMALYLIGSYGTQYQTPLSDMDFAILTRHALDFKHQVQMETELSDTLGEDNIDVVFPDRAPLQFKYVERLNKADCYTSGMKSFSVTLGNGQSSSILISLLTKSNSTEIMMTPFGRNVSMLDQAKIRQKIHFIRQSLHTLEGIREYSFEEFYTKPYVADACLRNMQIIIEALLDIGNHIIARKAFGLPKTYGDVVRIMVNQGILKPGQETT